MINPRGCRTYFEYDALNRRTRTIRAACSSDSAIVTTQYDLSHNVLAEVDPRVAVSFNGYRDAAGGLQPAIDPADSLVWLWCTNLYLIRYAAPVLDALGFSERSILTWVKTNFGTGDWLRSQTEHAVLAVRGKPTVTLTNESTVLFAPARGHSAKPVEFYELVERLLRVGWIALAPLGQWSILMGWPCQCKPAEPTP